MIREALRPNGALSKRSFALIAACHGTFAVLLWAFWPSRLLPSPSDVLSAWILLLKEEGMAYELYSSFVTNVEAIAISLAISLAISYGSVIPALRPVSSAVSKARFFGMTGFVVFFTVAFGAGHWLKVALLTFGMSVFFVTSMSEVVSEIQREEFDHVRTIGMTEWQAVWEVVVVGRADKVFEVLRQNAAIGWMMLTMVEGVSRSEGGIGTMLLNQNKHFHLASVFALQLTVLAVGMAQDAFIGWAHGALFPYSVLTLERK